MTYKDLWLIVSLELRVLSLIVMLEMIAMIKDTKTHAMMDYDLDKFPTM